MIDLTYEVTVDASALTRELNATFGAETAGGKVFGVSGPAPCVVHLTDSATPQDQAAVAALVATHVIRLASGYYAADSSGMTPTNPLTVQGLSNLFVIT